MSNREKSHIREPKLPDDLPAAFLERMQSTLGDTPGAFDAFLASYSEPPVRSLLCNTLRGASAKALPFSLSDAPVPWEPNGFYFTETAENRPGKHPLHETGACYIQEASAMLPARMLLDDRFDIPGTDGNASAEKPSAGLRVLDLCAAPGGKSVQLAMRLCGEAFLLSNEIHPARAKILSQNIERMGIRNAVVTNESPERLAERFPAFFDRILVDAPCSGEGMFRKDPAAIWEWSPEAVAACAARQSDILDQAAEMLAPGGRLVYSTCTFASAEDEEQIARFLARHPDFSLSAQRKLLPHETLGEGHFCALLIRAGISPEHPDGVAGYSLSRRPPMPGKTGNHTLLRSVAPWLSTFLKDPTVIGFAPDRLLSFGGHLYLVPPHCPDLTQLRTLRPGLHIADVKEDRSGCRLETAHALSHALHPADARFSLDLTDREAAAYLNGQALRADDLTHAQPPDGTATPDTFRESDKPRDILLSCRGFSLGWVHYANGLLKNRYPKGLRIPL